MSGLVAVFLDKGIISELRPVIHKNFCMFKGGVSIHHVANGIIFVGGKAQMKEILYFFH